MEHIGEKIRRIREAQGLTRQQFADITGLNVETVSATERAKSKPNSDKLQAICCLFPQYTLWLMTNQTNVQFGQISPADNNLSSKLTAIMQAQNLDAEQFAELTGINHFDKLSALDVQTICGLFPQYTLWLMTNQTNVQAGQVSPC